MRRIGCAIGRVVAGCGRGGLNFARGINFRGSWGGKAENAGGGYHYNWGR